MPEFILDTGTAESHAAYDALPDFTRGYLEAAFFCGVSLPEGDIDESDAFGLDALEADSLAEMAGDCAAFAAKHAADLAALIGDSYDMESAGRDYWFSRNGHGVGYWSRGFEGDKADAADRVDSACKNTESDLYADESGAVRVQPCGGYVAAGRKILEAATDSPDALPNVGGRFGAPMGRGDYCEGDGAGEVLAVRRVTLDPGGYDAGGAYWGIGDPLYRVTSLEGGDSFTRAPDKMAAIVLFEERFPAAVIAV